MLSVIGAAVFQDPEKHTKVYRVLDQGTGVLEISAPENTTFGWSFTGLYVFGVEGVVVCTIG
jgi:hypothetical protein